MREEFLETERSAGAGDPPQTGPADGQGRRRLAPGALIGRYVVLSELGAGAMGVVLAAYDPKLDRKVALKLIKALPGSNDRLGARLQREAQALAKLDHPNVVAVHDVGEHEGQLFVGMEYVEGQTLGRWMRGERGPRPWPELLRVFTEAGRGLAAAHEAGLIHRDFKPDNVMVGDDGRVRVMDFGLVRREDDEDEDQDQGGNGDGEEDGAEARAAGEELGGDLTRTGAMMGTPAYMPLEQFGGEVDARSDQFSFCVALYEALYGERPYAGESVVQLLQAIDDGELREPPRDTKVPGWLRKVVVRGLAADKQARWPSMTALLEALADDPALRRARWRGVGLAVLLGAGVALGAWYAVDQDARVCSGMDAPLAGVWDAQRRRELEAAIEGTQLSYAPQTWARIEARLDAYARAWVAARVEACEATHRGVQSGELLDRRMACLDERLTHLRAVVEVLAGADEEVVINAAELVEGLPKFEPCADVEALRDRVPLPEDPATALAVAALDARLTEIEALTLAGKYERGHREVEAVIAEATNLGYEPLLVRAWLHRGDLETEMGDYEAAQATLEQAYRAALGLRMMNEAAMAAARLTYIVGYTFARPREGRRWAQDAEALARAARSEAARGELLNNLGAVELREGKYEQALEHFTQAHAIRVEALGPKHPLTVGSLQNTGVAAAEAGDLDRARRQLERALALRVEVLGPEHPEVAASLTNLSRVAMMGGDYEGANGQLERAYAIKAKALGPDHPDLATTVESLGVTARELGRPKQARAHFERAVELQERSFGATHPSLVGPLESLGRLALAEGQLEQAQADFERAQAVVEDAFGPEHPHLVSPLDGLATVALRRGQLERARAQLERALAIAEQSSGSGPGKLAMVEHSLGELALASGEAGEAIPHLERALSLGSAASSDARALAAARFVLARALWAAPSEAGGDRVRARELAALARDGHAEAGDAKQRAKVERWLAARE